MEIKQTSKHNEENLKKEFTERWLLDASNNAITQPLFNVMGTARLSNSLSSNRHGAN
jgi:hypothetical protein